MTHLEKLNARYDQLERLLDAIDSAVEAVDTESRVKQQQVLEKYFTAEEGDIVECSYNSVSVRKAGSENKYYSFIDIYLEDNWNSEGREYTNFYISNSSFRTKEVAEWVIDRFTKQAHYTTIALDFQDDIIAELNQILENARSLIRDILKPARELKKESREISEEIQSIEKAARLEALMSEEGLTIEGVEKESYSGNKYREFPNLQVKFDWTINSIRGLRIDRMSTSGKSADITVKVNRWNFNTQQEEILDEKIERVRMDNIESFLRYNKISI